MTAVDTAAEAWHTWRRNGLGGSDVAAILGLSPWTSPWSLWADKAGLTERTDSTDAQEFGHWIEPYLAHKFTEKTGLTVVGEQTMCGHPEHGWMRCTVDGFAGYDFQTPEELDGYEGKSTSDSPWSEVPVYYQCQAQWTMAVTGTRAVWFSVLHLAFGRREHRVYSVARDEDDIALLIERASTFWHDHVLTGIPPATDHHPATGATLKDVFADIDGRTDLDVTDEIVALTRQRIALKAQAKALDEQIAATENAIKAALGDSTDGIHDGQLVVSWRPQNTTRIDTTRLRADHPDIADSYSTTTTSRVLRTHIKET
jgi:putative phage-type endonuclease